MFKKHKNIFNTPSYLASICEEYKGSKTKKITKEYGTHVSIFKLNIAVSTIEIGVDEDTRYTGQVISKQKNGKEILLFDVSKHGYDAIMGAGFLISPDSYAIKRIDSNNTVLLVFQYSTDEEEQMADENGGTPSDYFGTIVIYIESPSGIEKIFSFECQ